MRFKIIYLSFVVLVFCARCSGDKNKSSEQDGSSWIRPQAGTSFNLGDQISIQIKAERIAGIDSVVYFADGVLLTSRANIAETSIETGNIPLGNRLITAKIYRKGQVEEINTNIILRSNLIPQKFNYRVRQVFNHDTSSYTQGLEFNNDFLYESDGGNTPQTGYSSLRKVDIETGKVVQKIDLPQNIFAEGLSIVGAKIILLTWQNNVGIVYDKNTFEKISEFPYQNSRVGWGLCSDNQRLYKSDGSNLIYFLNLQNYSEEGYIEVYDQNGAVDHLNELEFINGEIYANIWFSNRIVIINPKNGQVTGEADMTGIFPDRNPEADVLNGIAWDGKGKRLFVTGKKWAKLFEVELTSIKDQS